MKTMFLRISLLLFVFFASNVLAQKIDISPIVLRDNWAICSSANLSDGGKVISQSGYAAKDWYPTSVPATILATLVANKVYANPYYGNNYFELPGVRRWDIPEGNPFESSWWYRTEFNLPTGYSGKHIWLKFHSVNYRANLWINGQKVADSTQMEGAYRLYAFDIAQYTKVGQKNCIALEIFPPKLYDLTISWVDWNPTPPDRGMGIWYDTGLRADESNILFNLDIPKTLTGIYFLKLSLQDKTGKEISSNFYWLSAQGDDDADFTGLAKLPPVDVTAKLSPLSKENGKLKLIVEFTNPSNSLAFGLNPKLLSAITKEPILPIFWQDNYFPLLPGEKRTIEMQVDASPVTEGKLLFKLDGWNLKAAQEQELTVP